MILKILTAKAGVPKTLVRRKHRLHSLNFPQNTLMLTESRGEFRDLHSIFRPRALRYLCQSCPVLSLSFALWCQFLNSPCSIHQYSDIAPRLSGQTSIFSVVFFVSKSLLGIKKQTKFKKFAILTEKPRSHVRILIYRTWATSKLSF